MHSGAGLIQLMYNSVLKPSLFILITVLFQAPYDLRGLFSSLVSLTKQSTAAQRLYPGKQNKKHQMVPEHYQYYHVKLQLDWSFIISDHNFHCIVPQALKLCKELAQKTLGLTVKGLSVGRTLSMRNSQQKSFLFTLVCQRLKLLNFSVHWKSYLFFVLFDFF